MFLGKHRVSVVNTLNTLCFSLMFLLAVFASCQVVDATAVPTLEFSFVVQSKSFVSFSWFPILVQFLVKLFRVLKPLIVGFVLISTRSSACLPSISIISISTILSIVTILPVTAVTAKLISSSRRPGVINSKDS